MDRRRPTTLFPAAALLAGTLLPASAGAQETYHACYVPEVGAIYLIQETDLPSECLSPEHQQISWTDGTDGGASADAWTLDGNAGTTPGTDFLGTTDGQALELHVNGSRALRLEPDAMSPNVVGGHPDNAVTSGAAGATVSGGGDPSLGANEVTDDFGTVGGGGDNQAGNAAGDGSDAAWATVAGGRQNAASGFGSVVGGGTNGTAGGQRSTVSGGDQNTASGALATVGGGTFNVASGSNSTVAGGQQSEASGNNAFAAGNNAEASGNGSIAIGANVTASGQNATALGWNTTASADRAVAMGWTTTASANAATAFGVLTEASGYYSAAMGSNTLASGSLATAMGYQTVAQSYASLVIGRFNLVEGTTAPWVDSDPLFVAGNGDDDGSRSNALKLDKDGDLWIAGTLTESSDARLKTDVEPLGPALERIRTLRPVRFRFRDGTGHPTDAQVGLLAQDVEAAFPELVSRDGRGYLSLAYPKLTAVLVKALQEQQAEIEEREEALETLREATERLETRNRHLSDRLDRLEEALERLERREP